jgi:hypothetical protein
MCVPCCRFVSFLRAKSKKRFSAAPRLPFASVAGKTPSLAQAHLVLFVLNMKVVSAFCRRTGQNLAAGCSSAANAHTDGRWSLPSAFASAAFASTYASNARPLRARREGDRLTASERMVIASTPRSTFKLN